MGLLVAWVIMSRSCAHDISYWMRILLQQVHLQNVAWRLNAFMVDDAGAKIKAIRCPSSIKNYLDFLSP